MGKVEVRTPGFSRVLEMGEGERVCPKCLGAVVAAGTKGDTFTGPDVDGLYITVCRECDGGRQRQCPFCGEWSAHPALCRCPGRHDAGKARRLAAEIAKFDTAQHLTVEQARAAGIAYVYFPGEDGDRLVEIGDIEWQADERRGDWKDSRPLFAWATIKEVLTLDADSIIENACEPLHEDARDNIGAEAEGELQVLLNAWCEKHGKYCDTYYPDHRRAVIVPASEEDADAS